MNQPRTADELIAQVAGDLRDRGERMTAARRCVLTALATTPGHLSAEDIHNRMGGDVPASSVYRALETLSRLGVVQHIHLGHGATAYHLHDGEGAHLHVECRTCGAVLDLPAGLLDPVVEQLDTVGFTLEPAHTALSGRCADCR